MKENVLIALSDQNLAKILLETLSQGGYFVENVVDGNDVLDRLKATKPDLALIDTVMPHKSGYDILNEKSLDRDITRIPVIVISNAGEPLQMKSIPATPMIRDYVVKVHVDPEEVIEKIDKIFGRGDHTKKETVEQTATKKSKVLWVEDDKLLGSILTKKFEAGGATLYKASNGIEAFSILQDTVPDIIILDIMLPNGMSGIDILEKIKAIENLKRVPVIILSNLSKQQDMEKARDLGANKFMIKATVSLDEIINEANKLVRFT